LFIEFIILKTADNYTFLIFKIRFLSLSPSMDTVGELKEGKIFHVPNVPPSPCKGEATQAKPAEAGLVTLAPAFYAGSGFVVK
jgi:hypothetical protein